MHSSRQRLKVEWARVLTVYSVTYLSHSDKRVEDGCGFHRCNLRMPASGIAREAETLRRITMLASRHPCSVDRGQSLDVGSCNDNPLAALHACVDEAGRGEEQPSSMFRLWTSGNEWNTQTLVRARMDSHQELDIPLASLIHEVVSGCVFLCGPGPDVLSRVRA